MSPNARVALISLSGTSIEWYDFFLYGIASALVFPQLFFPPELPPLLGLIASFSTFAVGFVARPLGGIVFGHVGDRHGRKRALVAALTTMGTATTLIGCLPTFATLGVWASLLLVSLRFVQGLAIGGQWGGAVLLATESAPPGKRGFYGGFAQAGAPIGVVLANGAVLITSANISNQAFMAWGWRIPFIVSMVLIGVALYAQLRVEETPSFRQLQDEKRRRDEMKAVEIAAKQAVSLEHARAAVAGEREPSPVLTALRMYPRQIALAAGAFIAIQVNFYILIAFVIAYGANPAILNLPRDLMLSAVLISSVICIPAVFISAAASDRYGRRRIFIVGAALVGLWGFVLFPLIDTGSFPWIVLAITVGEVLVALMYGPQAAFFAEMFSTRVRYSGASLGYQFGAIFGGAFAPLIATTLLATFGNTFGISVYIAIACAITIVSTLMLKETYRMTMHELPNETASSQHTASFD